MSGKYRRYDMIGAINRYCMKNDLLHITYVEKLRKSQLEEIEREKAQNFTQHLTEKFTETVKKSLDSFKGKIEMLESLLNDEQREKYLEYCDSQQSNLEYLSNLE